MRVRKNWQPFGLNLEAEMTTGIEPDPASESKRKTREVEIATTRNMGGADAGHHERLHPMGPLFHKGFMAEVSMKLIKNHALTGRLGQDVLRVDVGVLPCPSYFDQAIFLQAHTERSSIAGTCVEYDSRVCPCDMGVNRKAHDCAIADERGEIKVQRFWLGLLLRAETWREREAEQRDERTNIDVFASQVPAPPLQTLTP